jgi:hypothetical protein
VSITVITGPPGAGKTTVAAAVARSGPLGVHLVADQCFHWIVSGYVAPWLPESDSQNATVIGAIGAAAARYAEGGYDVVVDGIVGPWFLGRFQQAIGSAVDNLRYVVLRPSREVAQRRALGSGGPGYRTSSTRVPSVRCTTPSWNSAPSSLTSSTRRTTIRQPPSRRCAAGWIEVYSSWPLPTQPEPGFSMAVISETSIVSGRAEPAGNFHRAAKTPCSALRRCAILASFIQRT